MPLLCLFIICAINGNVKPITEKLHCRIASKHVTLRLLTLWVGHAQKGMQVMQVVPVFSTVVQ